MHEFVCKNGLVSKDNVYVTGSVTASNGFYGTVATASFANNASVAQLADLSLLSVTASYALLALTSSYTTGSNVTASNTAVTSSWSALQAACITVTHQNGTVTIYNPVSNNSSASNGQALLTASLNGSPGDVIRLAPTIYDLSGNTLDLSLNVGATGSAMSLYGAGKYQTVIKSSVTGTPIVRIGSSGSVSDLTISGYNTASLSQIALGTTASIHDVTLNSLYLIGTTSASIYLGTQAVSLANRVNIKEVTTATYGDSFNVQASGGEINLYGCDFNQTFLTGGPTTLRGIACYGGPTLTVFNTQITNNSSTQNGVAVYNSGSNAITSLLGCVINSLGTGGTITDIYNASGNGALLLLTTDTVFFPNQTTGSIIYLDTPQIQNAISASGVGLTSSLWVPGNINFGTLVGAQEILLYSDGASNNRYGFGIQSFEMRQFTSQNGHISLGTISQSNGTSFTEYARFDGPTKTLQISNITASTITANTSVTSPNFIGTASVATTANVASNITTTVVQGNQNFYPLFTLDNLPGNSRAEVDTGSVITYNPNKQTLTVPNITASLWGTSSWANTAINTNIGTTSANSNLGVVLVTGTGNQPETIDAGNQFLFNPSVGNLVLNGKNQLIAMNGLTSSYIGWSTVGVNAPTVNTTSIGTRLLLYPNVGAGLTDYAIGISAGTIWYGVPNTGSIHNWYGGTSSMMSLTSGDLTVSHSVIAPSFVGTASWAVNAVNGASGTTLNTASTYQITSSWANNVVSSSFASRAITSSFGLSAHLADSASYSSNGLTASFALNAHTVDTASYPRVPKMKSGRISSASFGNINPNFLTASVVFANPFSNALYAIVFTQITTASVFHTYEVTGSQLVGGFTASVNITTSMDADVFWWAVEIGEFP